MYSMTICYKGTAYFGWQKTISGPSIEGMVEKALFQISNESVKLQAASRTDRGVHAFGQVVQFSLQNPWEPKILQKALNAHLPKDIRVLEIHFKEFHPTLDAIGKEYIYKTCQETIQVPHKRLYSWHFYYPLQSKLIEKAACRLIGTHDFSAFSNKIAKNPLCTIESITFLDGTFTIRGDRFLYKMVRNIVGTLLYIGCSKLEEGSIEKILKSKLRKFAGMSAPAHGLYLNKVFYSEDTL